MKWLHLRFFGGVFEPDLDYRFAGFEAQSAAWDASTEDRLFVDMTDLDTGGIPVTGLRYQRGLHKANVDQAAGCAGASLCIHSPLSDCPLASHRECLNGRVVFQPTLGLGRYSKQPIDTESVPRRPLEPAAGASQDWEVTFDRLDQEPGGRVRGEIGLSLERGQMQEGDVYRGQWKFRFDLPVLSSHSLAAMRGMVTALWRIVMTYRIVQRHDETRHNLLLDDSGPRVRSVYQHRRGRQHADSPYTSG